MTSSRPVLIFDFGNVVAFFDYNRIGDVLGKTLGMDGATFMATARDRGFTPLLQQYESGRLSAEEFGKSVGEFMGLELSHETFREAFSDIFTLNEPVARLVHDLHRSGYTLVLGSNTNDMHATHFRKQFAEALAPFLALVMSHEVGHIKPSREFYLACAKAGGALPADCVFIDDLAENIEGARAAGLRGIVFRDMENLVADLEAEGIEWDEASPAAS